MTCANHSQTAEKIKKQVLEVPQVGPSILSPKIHKNHMLPIMPSRSHAEHGSEGGEKCRHQAQPAAPRLKSVMLAGTIPSW